MTMPVQPPFGVQAAYQDRQYGHGSIFTPAIPSVFYALVNPPTTGVAAEDASEDAAESLGFTPYGPYTVTWVANGAQTALTANTANLIGYTADYGLYAARAGVDVTVVNAGGTTSAAVQQLSIVNNPTGGTFTLTQGTKTTTAIAYNASATQIAAALNTALGAGTVTVTGTGDYEPQSETATVAITGSPTGGSFTLGFGGDVTAPIAYNASAAAVQSALQALESLPITAPGTDATQTITVTGSPTGGSFTLTYGGQTTTAIAYDAPATGTASVQSALVALSTIGTGNATVSGTPGSYTVTFTGSLGDSSTVTPLTATPSLTGGTSPTVTLGSLAQGTAPTYSVTVTGTTPNYTVSFTGVLADLPLAPLVGSGTALTGGTNPGVTVTINSVGQKAWVNQALQDNTRQHDAMRDFYDAASGNNFGQPGSVGWDGPSNNIYWQNQPSLSD